MEDRSGAPAELSMSHDEWGRFTMRFTASADLGALVEAALKEAKDALGGYFREFTFAKRRTIGWSSCGHGVDGVPGVVLDPFMGTGTTLRTAGVMGRQAIGVDLSPPDN
jgi:hypothetical protein